MEDAVADRVELETLDGCRRNRRAQHVVPLENLVHDDAVEEATESNAEQHGCDNESSPVTPGVRVVHSD
jgi:hypothetical protein